MKYNVNKQQLDILLMAGAAMVIMSIFYIFVYAPKQSQMAKLHHELDAINGSLSEIEKIVGSRNDLGKGILRLKESANNWELKFIRPDDTVGLLKILSEEARHFNLEVASIQPAELKILTGKNGEILKLEDLVCHTISINMNLTGSYAALANYMQKIEHKDTPQLIVKRFDIEKTQSSSRLNIHMVVEGIVLLPKLSQRG